MASSSTGTLSLYESLLAKHGPEYDLPTISLLYLGEVRLCLYLSQRCESLDEEVEVVSEELRTLVHPLTPGQALLALSELGLVSGLVLSESRAVFTPSIDLIRAIVDDAEHIGIA